MPVVLETSWVGRRVSVRRVLDRDPDGRLRFGDVVGDLAGLDAQTAVVETRDGLVEVPVDHIAIARLVPPSTAGELALEAVAARGLRAADTAQLGGWLLRADHGFTRRANSVLPLRQLGMPLDDALARAAAWYAERGLPLRVHVPVEARRLLDAELGERGWPADGETHVLAGRLDALHADVADLPPVRVADGPDERWLACYRDGSGLTETGRALLTRHDRVAFADLEMDGRTVAVARGAVDDGWLGVMAVEVEPAYRRQRLATAVTAALWQWGAAQGATRSYLQVFAENAAAIALYEKLGYWVHHDYHYRTEPAPAESCPP
jgi:ribosomal protein S18 acetylase RimI-like enzyme